MYNLDGQFVRKIDYPEYPDTYSPWQTIALDSVTFFSNLTSIKHLYHRGMFFGKDSTIPTFLFENYIDRELEGKMTWGGYETAYLWNSGDAVRYHRVLNDTVYAITPDRRVKPSFVFDYGKYKAEPVTLLTHGKLGETIHITGNICESSKYLFLTFDFHNNAPEKFKQERKDVRTGKTRVEEVRTVYGIFAKETGELQLLNQPIKHKQLGLRNDVDGGPCFWPKYVSSEGEMVTWWGVEEFLEAYKQLTNPSAELKTLAEKLTPDDNPVLMVVTLK